MSVTWDNVTQTEVERAIGEYDRLGAEGFYAAHGFGPTTTYDLIWQQRRVLGQLGFDVQPRQAR